MVDQSEMNVLRRLREKAVLKLLEKKRKGGKKKYIIYGNRIFQYITFMGNLHNTLI